MEHAEFIALLQGYGLPSEDVYEDISEVGVMLWHDRHLAIQVAAPAGRDPHLKLVTSCGPESYAWFEHPLRNLSPSDMGDLLLSLRKDAEWVRETARSSVEELGITLTKQGRTISFKRAV